MQTFYKICLLLLIVGGVNWGLVGLFQFDLVGLAALGCIPELFTEEPEEE